VSRSAAIGVIAICRGASVGVDVEQLAPRDFGLVANTLFSPAELSTWKQSSDPLRFAYSIWTSKEAYLKAVGVGLSVAPKRITVSVQDRARFLELDFDSPSDWTLFHLSPVPGYVTALAARSRNTELLLRRWEPSTALGS